jgi:hypothetical protein
VAQPRCDTTVSIAGGVRGVWGGRSIECRVFALTAYSRTRALLHLCRLWVKSGGAGALAPVPPLGKIGRGGPACLCNVSDLFSPRRRVAAVAKDD